MKKYMQPNGGEIRFVLKIVTLLAKVDAFA